jgi:hypothetical protein
VAGSEKGGALPEYVSQLVRANASIVVFTVIHLVVWGIFLGYRGFVLVGSSALADSYQQWSKCVFHNFGSIKSMSGVSGGDEGYLAVCGHVPAVRIPFTLALTAVVIVVLYGALMSSMHFWSLARKATLDLEWPFVVTLTRAYVAATDFLRRDRRPLNPLPNWSSDADAAVAPVPAKTGAASAVNACAPAVAADEL